MPSTSGGAASAGGHEYQAQVAAYFAIAMLCAPAFSIGWNLPSGTTVEAVRCEIGGQVDDIELLLGPAGVARIQAKRSITVSSSERSELAKTIRQFVGAFLDAEGEDTPLTAADSRMVLATSGSTSRAIREDLPILLARAMGELSTPLDQIEQTNSRQRTVWPAVLQHLRHAWQARTGQALTDDQLRPLLALLRVQQLDFGPEGRDEAQGKANLINHVLASAGQADLVFSQLTGLMLSNAAGQRGIDRTGLIQSLADAQVRLRQLPSVRDDIVRLAYETNRTLRTLKPLSEIKLADRTVKLRRSAAATTITRAIADPCLLVGEPGGGKSGVLYDAVAVARDQGRSQQRAQRQAPARRRHDRDH